MDYTLEIGPRTQLARRKILLKTSLVVFAIIAIALVIALPIIFTSRHERDQNRQSSGQESKDSKNLRTTTSAPERDYFITVQDVNVFTNGKLEVQIGINLQYFPTNEDLAELNQTYGAGFEVVLEAEATDAIKSVFPQFSTREAFMKSKQTRSVVCAAIVDRLEDQCCKNMTSCANFNYDISIFNSTAAIFDQRLRDETDDSRVLPYLLFTMDYRKKQAEALPVSTRVQNVFDRYPFLRNIDPLILNLVTTIHVNTGLSLASMDRLKQNVLNMTNIILDYLFSNNLTGGIQRNSLETEDQQVLFAFSKLPTIFQEEETVVNGKVLPQIIYKVEGKSWSEEARRQNMTSTPWILHHENQNNSFIAIMIEDSILVNVTSASESIIGLMGVYYFTFLPYPPQHNGTFLFIKSEILEDIIDSANLSEVQRLKQTLQI